METLIAPIASGVISAIVAAFGCYVAITNRLTRVETLIETLNKNVEKHNNMVERMAVVERDLQTAFTRIDENKTEIKYLEAVKIGGTQ